LRARGILDKELFQEYKNLRNTVVRLIRKEKPNYYTSLLENYDDVWNVLSEVIPTKNSKKKVKKQRNDCFDAEKLNQTIRQSNQHFITAAAKKVSEIEITEDSYNALNIDILSGKQFSLTVIDNKTVQKRVETLNETKTTLNAIEKKKKLLLLDLFKAFDSVDHNLLVLKLFMIGCDLISMKWFKSYLSNRF
jgi:hypothetical protein